MSLGLITGCKMYTMPYMGNNRGYPTSKVSNYRTAGVKAPKKQDNNAFAWPDLSGCL